MSLFCVETKRRPRIERPSFIVGSDRPLAAPVVLFRGGIKPALELDLPTSTYCAFVIPEGSGGAVF